MYVVTVDRILIEYTWYKTENGNCNSMNISLEFDLDVVHQLNCLV